MITSQRHSVTKSILPMHLTGKRHQFRLKKKKKTLESVIRISSNKSKLQINAIMQNNM